MAVVSSVHERKQDRRNRRGWRKALLVVVLAGGVAAAIGGSIAQGASVVSASFSGGSFTDASGTVYAKQNAALTLSVTTDNTTKCVRVTDGTTTVEQTSATAKTSWSFSGGALFTAGAGDGVKTVTATAFRNFNGQGKCTANAGEADGPKTASYILDNTGPVVSGAVSPTPNGAGWQKATVTITWTATDAGSGVATGPTPATDSVTTDTPGVTKTSSAVDRVGNAGTGSVTVKRDGTAPAIDGSRSPAANASGWNNTDVTVTFTCSDALSGVKSCVADGTAPASASRTLSTNGANQSVAGTATDVADNSRTATVTGISIDKVPPTLTGAPVGSPNGAGWFNGDVTIAWTCADPLSGIPAGACPGNSTIKGEGTGLTASASVSDRAENRTNADSAAVKIDRTAPSTDATAPAGWNNTDVTVKLAGHDALSGVKATFYALDGGAQQPYDPAVGIPISAQGMHSLEFWSVDNADNVETHKTVPVKIDKTPPSITHTLSPLPNLNGWNNSNVTIHFVCADQSNLSGIASCTPDQVISTEGKDQITTGTAKDNAGNTATDPASVSIDKTSPTITASRDRAPNANGWYRDNVTVSFTCSDPAPAPGIAPSGIDTCSAPKDLGEASNQTASGTAVDAAGNSASASEGPINIDKTPPVLVGAPTTAANGAGWYNADVVIAWSCSDPALVDGSAGSGIPLGACPPDDTITGEGTGLKASASVSDKAGNTTNANSASVRIDRTAPSTSASVPAPLDSGWYAGPVQVTLNAADPLSGVDKTFYSVDGGAAQLYTGAFSHSLGGRHTITFWSTDNAGNTEDKTADGHSITLKIDNVPPSISGSRVPAANGFGWNNTPVTASFFCDDAESGIGFCSDPITLSAEGAGQSATGNATDNAGNSSEATVNGINIDLTPPDISSSLPDPSGIDAAGAKWYRGDVTVTWLCSDGLSGIAAGACPAASTILGEARNLGAGPVSVSDKADNQSSASVGGVNIDRNGPVIAGTATTSPNAAGWYNGAVKVGFTCTDPALADLSLGSGVAACPSDKELTSEGANQSVTSDPARDYAGNSTPGKAVGGISIDGTPPVSSDTVQCTLVNGFCNGSSPVTMTISARDQLGLSGVKEIRYSTDNGETWKTSTANPVTVPLTLSASGQAIVKFFAVDNADNAEAMHADSVNFDGTAPTVTHALTPAANAADWSNRDTLVHFSAVDDPGGSGVNAATVTPDKTYTAETASLPITGSADDNAANHGTDTFTFKLDKTPPTITASRSPATGNANGWNNTPVTVSFLCSDPNAANGAAPSGVAVCPDPVTVSTNNAAGSPQSVTRTATDLADNTANATVGNINVDMEAPSVTINGVKDDGIYELGAVPAASCTAGDDFSGLAAPCKTTVSGGLANGVGAFTYTAAATDKAGNTTTKTVTYRVIYSVPANAPFFLQPINDTAHTVATNVSIFKGGSTVPVKFQLKKADGTVVQANGAPTWLTPVRGSLMTAPVDESGFTTAADTITTFRFDATARQYIYNWGTSSTQAGYFWRIGVKLDDGQSYTTAIGLRK
jgi:hypothetical protein